jgi:hypothetical protein
MSINSFIQYDNTIYDDCILQQRITSSNTSIKRGVSPAIKYLYDNLYIKSGMKVLDYGAGKYSRNANYLRSKNIDVFAYDPYNYTHGNGWDVDTVSNSICNEKFDIVFTSYVLNVVEYDISMHIMNDVCEYSNTVYHIVRNNIHSIAENTIIGNTYNKYVISSWNKYIENNSDDNTVENLKEFAKYGFMTKKDCMQREHIFDDSYFKLKCKNGWCIYKKEDV